MVTSTIKKEIKFSNEIKIDDKVVKNIDITINSENPLAISKSQWTTDEALYKANRVEIRKKEAEFEDLAYAEQDKMIAELEEKGE